MISNSNNYECKYHRVIVKSSSKTSAREKSMIYDNMRSKAVKGDLNYLILKTLMGMLIQENISVSLKQTQKNQKLIIKRNIHIQVNSK